MIIGTDLCAEYATVSSALLTAMKVLALTGFNPEDSAGGRRRNRTHFEFSILPVSIRLAVLGQ
jgi:hypothetical protein